MTYSNPKTLTPGTPENVSDAQSNFDAVADALNGILGDIIGSFDSTAVDKVTKTQLRVGTGGTVESTEVTSIDLRSNYNPATGHLIDSTQASVRIQVGHGDAFTLSIAPATSGVPSYATVLTIDETGLPGATTTVADRSITGTKVALNTLTDENLSPSAGIAQTKVANLVSALASKAALNHTHSISQVTNLQSSLDGKASTSSVALKAPKDAPTFTSGITVNGGASVGGGLDVTTGATSLGGSLTADGVAQFNNGLSVDGAGTTLDGGTLAVQPLQGGGFTDSNPSRFKVTSTGIGFHGNTPITRRTISGARDDATASGALENLLNFFDDLGLIHDSTTAH